MIVERSTSEGWLSNTWLVADRPGGRAVVIDPGAPPEPILDAIAALDLAPSHVLVTHHHPDHVGRAGVYRQAYGCPVLGHGAERELFAAAGCPLDRELGHGEELASGDLRLRALHVPGHTVGQLAFLVNAEALLTGDTLFAGSVGGTRGRGHGTFEQLRTSILDVLLAHPPTTRILPGHGPPSTVGAELARNPFVRAWRGQDLPAPRPCRALGHAALLLLEARDYDGGTKCWVRFEDGREDVVPGSRVEPG